MIQPPQQQGPSAPSIVLTVTDPRIQIAEIGSTVRLRCSGQSLVGRQVLLRWGKEGAPLPPGRAQDDRRGVLIISDVRHSDSGTYVCSGQDGLTVVTETVVLNVGGKLRAACRLPCMMDLLLEYLLLIQSVAAILRGCFPVVYFIYSVCCY